MKGPEITPPVPFLRDPGAAARLERYVRDSIPLVVHMDVRVLSADIRGVVLEAPLAPNRNHVGTAFGASLHGLATLAGWGLVWLALEEHPEREVVVAESSMRYRLPANATFQARCLLPPAERLAELSADYASRGRARLVLDVHLLCGGNRVAEFEGTFVATRPKRKG
jgi:thioesterase domain-containing protein